MKSVTLQAAVFVAALLPVHPALLHTASAETGAVALEDVVVTATRRSISAADALPPVIIIGREEIELYQALDVAELLRFHAGIEIARNGGPGQVTSVFIRGANSNHTLVLLDGVKINPGTAGGAALQNITPELIERIEIVKGPRSSLYGSEAIGGVIHIITRRGGMGRELGASVQAGHYGTRGGAANLSYQQQDFGAGISATALRVDGFPTFQDSDEDSGFENDAFNAWVRAGHGNFDIEASHWQASGNVEYLDFFRAPQDQDFTNRVSRVRLGWNGHAWRSAVTVSRFLERIEQGELAFDPEDFAETDRDMVDWQTDFDLVAGLELTAGVTLTRERTRGRSFGTVLESSPGRGSAQRDDDAYYLQAGYDAGRHRFAAAGRHTRDDVFGSVNTWNLEWGVALTPDWSVVAGTGRGFRAPGTNDLYAFGGNPDLKPEDSRSVDLGIRHRPHPDHELELALFRTRITDLIEFFDPDGFMGPLPGRNENIGDARVKGAELGWRARFDTWRVSTTLLYQQPEDRDTGETLLRRAEKQATAQATYLLGGHEIGVQFLATGPRRDFGDVRLAGYGLMNLVGRFALSQRWALQGRIENLFDRDYELVDGYNTPGRGIYATMTYSY